MYGPWRVAAMAARPLTRHHTPSRTWARYSSARYQDHRGLFPTSVTTTRWKSASATLPPDPVPPSGDATQNTIAEEKDSGHFEVKHNEAILFFENIFPLKLINLLRRRETDRELTDLVRRFDNSKLGIMDPIRLVKMAIPEDMPIKVTEIMPRLKDGGAFVKFRYRADLDPMEIETTLKNKLRDNPLKPWFNPFRGVQARLVRGTPWLEDLHRYPASVLRVEFVPAQVGASPEKLPEEALYAVFRRYGKIADIVPQPYDSKEVPNYASVRFVLLRDAIMARNCAHGFVVPKALGGGKNGTALRISYTRRAKGHNLWNWLTDHPRIVFPIIAALLAGFSVVIFDPIRQFFIGLHIKHSLNFSESRIYKWFQTHRQSFSFSRRREHWDSSKSAVWNHRMEVISQLREWLDVSSENFIVVTGPRGSGKVEIVMEKALEDRQNVLLIDCKPIVEARGESTMIGRLAAAVGYRPVFSWANSISSLIDLAVQSTTGVKAGFSETLESQLTKILYTTATVLRDVALSGRSSKERDGSVSEDSWLEDHPERRPVIVIDNFLHKSDEKSIVYDKMSEWAASLVQNHAAQVIFLTSETVYSKPLTRALPDRVFHVLSLGDLDHDAAKKYITGRIQEDMEASRDRSGGGGGDDPDGKKKRAVVAADLDGLDRAIESLGGRLVDLESLSRRIQAGLSAPQATDEMVAECATDIVKMFLLGGKAASASDGEAVERKWSVPQAWHLIKALAGRPSVPYNEVLLSPTFASSTTTSNNSGGGEAALESLAAADLVAIRNTPGGHPGVITPGRRLLGAAFARIAADTVLAARMDLARHAELVRIDTAVVDAAERELVVLGQLPRQSAESAARVGHLLGRLGAAQRRIERSEGVMAGCRAVLCG